MANFDWREHSSELLHRFPEWVSGFDAWLRFAGLLREIGRGLREADPAAFRFVKDRYSEFLDALESVEPAPRDCRVFVSHQRRDIAYAERIAWLATRAGFEYWLDAHDPTLSLANVSNLPAVTKSFAIAAIIEMALLNCSHVIGVQTVNSRASRWVPYEFGRGKRPIVVSNQAASWFEPNVLLDPAGDYLALARLLHTEQDIVDWLRAEARAGESCDPFATQKDGWQGDEPPLP